MEDDSVLFLGDAKVGLCYVHVDEFHMCHER